MAERPAPGIDLVPDGITAGVVAGAIMIVAHMLASFELGGTLEGPLRLLSSIVLGPAALSRVYPFVSAAVVGASIHFVLSALYGVFFVTALGRLRRLDVSAHRLLLTGAAFGAILWVTNYQILAAVFFPAFAVISPSWLGLLGHSIFFGIALGLYVVLVKPGRTRRRDGQAAAP
jgi:hypothetical protein